MKNKKLRHSVILMALLFLINIHMVSAEANNKTTNKDEYTAGDISLQQEKIPVKDIDLGDYQKEMEVGENQLLMVTVLPTHATVQEVSYSSSNESVATINAMGRLTAIAAGQAEISIKAEQVEKRFTIMVKEKEVEERITVFDIEISEFEEEMEVGKTQNISAVVLPSDAENQAITYKSTNPQVATISGTGKITGISKGSTIIQLKADGVIEEVKLTVNIPTSSIDVNETYIVLKSGSTYQLKAQVLPKDAKQRLSYRSTNEDVVSVNHSGIIQSQKTGKASVILSNRDMQKSVTVIVNKDGKAPIEKTEDKNNSEDLLPAKNEILKTLINTKGETLRIESPEDGTISKEILKYLFENKKTLNIMGNGYTIIIKGEDITNYENPLSTQILFGRMENGRAFVINDHQNLPGKISLVLSEDILGEGKHVYLYHKEKEKYEILNTKVDKGHLELDIAGQYLIADRKISPFKLNTIGITIAAVCIIILVVVYIFVKKKYWFW